MNVESTARTHPRLAVEHSAGRIPVIAPGTGANSPVKPSSSPSSPARLARWLACRWCPTTTADPGGHVPALPRHCRSQPAADDSLQRAGPHRCRSANDTTLRLAEIPNIIGIKDATGSIDRACDLVTRAPKDFALYTGDDMTAMAFMMLGGHGTISVTANVAPRLMHEMCVAAIGRDGPRPVI